MDKPEKIISKETTVTYSLCDDGDDFGGHILRFLVFVSTIVGVPFLLLWLLNRGE